MKKGKPRRTIREKLEEMKQVKERNEKRRKEFKTKEESKDSKYSFSYSLQKLNFRSENLK